MLKLNNYPSISIVIPTHNSENVLEVCLKSISKQKYPSNYYEVLVIDNHSIDKTIEIAKKYKAKVYKVDGVSPQTCAQRNFGAEKATKDYVYYLDHDMELSPNLLEDFSEHVNITKNAVGAWFVPERVLANSNLLSKIRTFERSFYNKTVVDGSRIIKRKLLVSENIKYDIALSSGPADWDLDIQLIKKGCKFGIINEYILHHEERLSFWNYVMKKNCYATGINIYIEKWKREDRDVFNKIVSKQFGFFYRSVGVFVEGNKWKKLLLNLHLYLCVCAIKILMVSAYLFKSKLSVSNQR